MSRFRSIAPAIGMTLVLAACTAQTPTPSPSAAATAAPTAAPTEATSEQPPSAEPSAEAPSAQACATNGKFTGINVNILTFNGPQVAEPLRE